MMDIPFDYVITVCSNAEKRCPAFSGKARGIHVGFDDPPSLAASAETEEEAYKLYREPAEYFYGRCLHVDPRFLAAPGYVTQGTQRAGLESQLARTADINRTAMAVDKSAREFDAILENGYVIIGTTDQVAERLREVAKDLNVGHLMLLLQFGNMSKDVVNYNSKLYGYYIDYIQIKHPNHKIYQSYPLH